MLTLRSIYMPLFTAFLAVQSPILAQAASNTSISPAQSPKGNQIMTNELSASKNSVSFKSQGHILAGDLYVPDNFDPEKTYPTIVFTGPFNQVKEQTGAVYAKKLAGQGFITLVFDHRGYGDSEGELRSYEYSPAKLEGISDAISYLRTLKNVDKDNVFGLGVCAGGSQIAYAALTDKRMNAIATVSGMLNNTASMFMAMDRDTAVTVLKSANEARQKYYETGLQESVDLLGMENTPTENTPRTVREGHEFYMTKRAGAETYPNYTHKTPLFVHEDYPRYNATAIAPYLYTPVLGIYGSDAMGDTGPLTIGFIEAASEPKELFEVEGASHVSLYDIDKDADRAVEKIAEHFNKYTQD